MYKLSLLCLVATILLFSPVNAGNQTCLEPCRLANPGGAYNPSCCDCCGSTATCNGNAEFSSCCGTDELYCGCLSSRAACSGFVPSGVNKESPFGTCYPKSFQGTCSYDPNPNVWVLCPTGTTACIAGALGSCCSAGQTCNKFYGYCETPSSAAATSAGSESNGQALCNGQAYDSAAYTCAINDQGSQVLCPTGNSACGGACYSSSAYCCQSGSLRQAGQCDAQTSAQTSSPQTSPQTSSPQTSSPQTSSNGGIQYCNGQPIYQPDQYSCATNDQGKEVLCPKNYGACGNACYPTDQYCCKNGGLQQIGQC